MKSRKADIRMHAEVEAVTWTRFFREQNPMCNVSDAEMFNWFENAMIAMGDFVAGGTLINGDHSKYLVRN
jgi:hypothetical protein